MTRAVSATAAADPFTRRSALLLIAFGALILLAFLWMVGTGLGMSRANDGGGHVDGHGLNGYAALAQLLERQGHPVQRSRHKTGLAQPGLLILTPNAQARGVDIDAAVSRHRALGPTVVITPKWLAVPVAGETLSAREGWVRLIGPAAPNWPGFLDELTVNLDQAKPTQAVRWQAHGVLGTFPDSRLTMFGAGPGLVPLVTGPDGRIYAAYRDDGEFPRLAALASRPHDAAARDRSARYPLILVFDPDLLDNYGMARLPSARLADLLVAALATKGEPVVFYMTLAGLEVETNLLTLAFTPPFLAATLCLVLAAGAVGWRAFLRFGPPLAPARAIAFGKRALVTNAAGLVRRSGRLHLLGPPYAQAARRRLARAFALPPRADPAAELAAIDRAAEALGEGGQAFSTLSTRLSQARSAHDLVKAARDIHALERTLNR